MKSYQDIAADGGSDVAEQVERQVHRLQERMASVRSVVAVMSGKGGVGKSTVAVNLADALALDGHSVGLVDADLNGPSAARMSGVSGQKPELGPAGVEPVVTPLGVKLMSMDLFLPDKHTPVRWKAPTHEDAYTWRSTMEVAAVREFLSDAVWGRLDQLIIDLPPGAPQLSNLVNLLPELSGTIVVTIPSQLSRLVVGKSLRLADELLDTPVIGLVENMSSYVCSHCGAEEELFPSERPAEDQGTWDVPLLGRIPFDPRLSAAADEGRSFIQEYGEAPAGRAFYRIADGVTTFLSMRDAR